MKQSTKIILAILGVSIVALTLIGITVAFFSASITGGTESLSANTVVLGNLSGTGNPITLTGAEPGTSPSTNPYTVTYASGATVAKKYSLSLVITNNEFVNTVKDLQNSSTTQGGQLVIEVTIPNTVKTFTFNDANSSFITYSSSSKKITIDATNGTVAKNGTYKLLTGVYIGPGATQGFTVSVQFKNLESYNQNDNQGKSFSGYLTLENAVDTEIMLPPALTSLNYLNNSSHANGSITVYDKTTNASNYTNKDAGIYKDTDTYGDTYFFRGNVTNNYVKFADRYWRIIRINGDGTLRLIYDGTQGWDNGADGGTDRYISLGAYNKNNGSNNVAVGYMYGDPSGSTYNAVHANTTSSTIKNTLDTWYENNLKNDYASFIADEIFCNDRSLKSGTGIGDTETYYASYNRAVTQGTPSFLCNRSPYTGDENKTGVSNANHDAFTVSDTVNGNGDLTYPIGLITLDEVVFAGFDEYDTGFYLDHGKKKNGNVLYIWTISPSRYWDEIAFGIQFASHNLSSFGNIDYISSAVVPVINLTAEASLTLIGQGTKTSPFELPSN